MTIKQRGLHHIPNDRLRAFVHKACGAAVYRVNNDRLYCPKCRLLLKPEEVDHRNHYKSVVK